MPVPKLVTDGYERRARLVPALLVCFPAVLTILSAFPDFSGLQFLVAFLAYFGLTALVAQLGRDQGKKREPWLFDRWGGKPTTQLLRHRNEVLDEHTKRRYHQALSVLLPRQTIPTATGERENPAAADAAYDSCTRFLRERTRDHELFKMIYAENVNYGFRRNLWAMKGAGLVIAAAAVVASLAVSMLSITAGVPRVLPVISSVVNAFMLVWWLLRIRPEWVRPIAFAYAEQLLSACDTLHRPEPPKQTVIIP